MKIESKKYRVVHILAPGVMAGTEKVVQTGLMALADLGSNPLMIIIRETRIPKLAEEFQKSLPSHIESILVDSTKAFDLQLPKRIQHILDQQKLPCLLHSHGFKALIACYMCKGKRPHVHTHHGNTSHTLKVKIYEKIAQMTMKTCKRVVAVSSQMEAQLIKDLAPYKNITIIENMLSLQNAKSVREAVKNERELKKSHKRIINLIFIGRLSPEKGLSNFIEIFSSHPQRENFHLNVLGDGPEKKEIEIKIKEKNLTHLVSLLGFVKDPSIYLTKSDLLIMPSLREGLPMTLIESLASGIPVIGNNVGALSSLVINNHNGHLTEKNDIQNWNQILNLSVERFEEWGTQAMRDAESIETRFSAHSWANKTLSLYNDVIMDKEFQKLFDQ